MRAHFLDRLHEIGQAFERVVLALHRDQHRVGGAQAVERQQRQRRRAIEQDEIVFGRDLVDRRAHLRQRFGQRVLQPRLALGQVDQLDFRAGELAIGGHEIEAAGRRQRRARRRSCARRAAPGRRCASSVRLSSAGAGGGVALRIEIDQQHAALHRGEARGEVDGGGRLADAALLVGDRDDARHRGVVLHHDQVALRHRVRARAARRARRRANVARQLREFLVRMHAFHRDQHAAAARRWRAPTSRERREIGECARDHDVERRGRREVLDARCVRRRRWKPELDRRLREERALLVIRLEQRRRASGPRDRQRNAGNAAAAADIEHAQRRPIAADRGSTASASSSVMRDHALRLANRRQVVRAIPLREQRQIRGQLVARCIGGSAMRRAAASPSSQRRRRERRQCR